MRFYQMQLTIPGQLDVMGAALPGLPVVNIGFNKHLAWTHTVDTSKHFTVYRLQLDPKDPTRYLLDGQSLPLEQRKVSVTVKGEGGALQQVERPIYLFEVRPGGAVARPAGLGQSGGLCAARCQPLENTRVLQQWYRINRADSLGALQASVAQLQGIPWVNTLAVDAKGRPVPEPVGGALCRRELLARCGNPGVTEPVVVLDGSRSACQWKVDAQAAAGDLPGAPATEPGAQRLRAAFQ
jgi:acyl-homoserine-lactone acylase